jgi:hypothetical protein
MATCQPQPAVAGRDGWMCGIPIARHYTDWATPAPYVVVVIVVIVLQHSAHSPTHLCIYYLDLWFLHLFTAVRLGDQCFYRQTCAFTDQHAICIQINHNAICQCKPGYHTVALQRPTKKVFCSEGVDLVHMLFFERGSIRIRIFKNDGIYSL